MAAAMLAAVPAGAQSGRGAPPLAAVEWKTIRDVIAAQLAALKAGDGDRAFGYAAPGIRRQFGDARVFMQMVRDAYGALLGARYTEFLEGAVIDGIVVQPLRLVAADDSVLVALYTMERQQDGRWQIAGCALAPSTVRSA